jgi:leucyl-tRNA synthetase
MKNFSLNTVVSAFMEFNNKFQELSKTTGVDKETLCTYARLLAPFAPHIAEELWEALGNKTSVFEAGWPEYDEKLMEEDTIEIPVQVNGKTKVVVTLPKNVSKDEAIKAGHDAVDSKLSGNVVKEIFVPGRIINFVIK